MEYIFNENCIKNNRIVNKRIIYSFLEILAFIFVTTFYFIDFFSTLDIEKDLIINISFFSIGLFSILSLCLSKNFISVKKIFFTFIFVFFYYTAFKQYSNSNNLWNHVSVGDDEYLTANLLILISCFCVEFFCFVKKNDYKLYTKSNDQIKVIKSSAIILTCINILIFLYFFLINGIFSREGESLDTIMSSVQKVLRFIPAATILVMRMDYKYNKTRILKMYFLINLIIVSVLFFPLAGAIPRFLLFGTYLILFADWIKRIKLKSLLPFILLFCLCIIFPAFNFFKSHEIYDIASFDYTKYGFDYGSVDYDAYQIFLETIRFTKDEGISYGKNIITAFLFFIPRSIWLGKLEPTGSIIASFYGAWFVNISCPYIAEFYYAFGALGSILGSIILGYAISIFDSMSNGNSIVKKSYSYVIIGVLLYWLRGSMLPTTAFSFALIIALTFTIFVIKIARKISGGAK